MKIRLAIEWFLNPDHLPFIVALHREIFKNHGIDFELIEPDEHYDGLEELKTGTIEFATNEPLHLIEQFDERYFSLGMFFETKGGVLLKSSSYEKLETGKAITVTTPVSNPTTDAIGFEILRRYCANKNIDITRDQVTFVANGFEHLKYMKEGADAGWLYFYNFEGIEARHEGMEVLCIDAATAGFANFSALDIFVNRRFYEENTSMCTAFVRCVKEAIAFIRSHPEEAIQIYYDYTGSEPSALMDDILHATMSCFDPDFSSSYGKELPILEFFTEIGITSLPPEQFKNAFLE